MVGVNKQGRFLKRDGGFHPGPWWWIFTAETLNGMCAMFNASIERTTVNSFGSASVLARLEGNGVNCLFQHAAPGAAVTVRPSAAMFPTLEADLDAGPDQRATGGKRICIATPDILGPVRNGGIGTAYHHLARVLTAVGHDVVIAYVNNNAFKADLMAETRTLYAGFGIAFEPIEPQPAADSALARIPAPTWTLLAWLRARERPFDLVHFPDWHGLGYGPLLAKSLGLGFGATHMVVMGHAPTLWNVEGNRQLMSTEEELAWMFMERRSVELADTFISVSAHLIEWMREAGYSLPARTFVWPNVFPEPDRSPEAVAARAARAGAPLDEVVFFGRLEPRKGLVLFVDAIDRLVRQGRAPSRVTFLGTPARRFDAAALIERCTKEWPLDVRAITDRGANEAVAYLSQPGRLAVVPSLVENCSMAVLECLHAGIPFLAAATGGTPELVAEADHDRALVAPDHGALGERLAALAAAPLRPAHPAWDFDRTREVWARWHAGTACFRATADRFAARAQAAEAETPPVTVCIVHHERPALVRMAADSVLAQDYPALEAVLVDDGSEGAEARAAVDEIEAAFGPRGWRVIRQENRYLGAARNAAAAAARGEWLLFLDDDNVLLPDAVVRLVRAARFSGADCVTAASIRFFDDGDPRTDSTRHGAPIRFVGAARAWNRLRNVVGDACALVRREAFAAAGGFDEERGFALSDLAFFNRLVLAGRRVEALPDPVYYYRVRPGSMITLLRDHRLAELSRVLALAPYLTGKTGEERGYAAYAAARLGRVTSAAINRSFRQGCALALARRSSRLGIDGLEASILLDADWLDRAWRRNGRPVVELRRNGRLVARRPVDDLHLAVPVATIPPRLPILTGALYSLHDAADGETLAVLTSSTLRGARRVAGAVENRPQPEVRGWLLDEADPGRRRRVGICVDGRLRAVVRADGPRRDIARWKGTDGLHGFHLAPPRAGGRDEPHAYRYLRRRDRPPVAGLAGPDCERTGRRADAVGNRSPGSQPCFVNPLRRLG